jgi:hypothetical protein
MEARMQPCHVCGGMAIDAAGYCVQCRTYRGQVAPPGYPPGYPAHPPAPAPPGGGRSPFLIPLIALCVTLAIVAVGIVVVVVVKSNRRAEAQPGSGPTARPQRSAAIDPCLVGNWTIIRASQQFPIDGVGNVQLTLKTGTQTLAIQADGSVEDNYGGDSRYEGSGGGHTYTLDVSGKAHYTIRTVNSTITFLNTSADGSIAASIDGISVTSVPLSVTSDPAHYTCSGNTATEHTDNYDATLTRSAS